MIFAADKNAAVFGNIKIFVDEYSVERTAEAGGTVLIDGRTALRFGGGGTVRIKLIGSSSKPCADKLDTLLKSGERIKLAYAGIETSDLITAKYSCAGKSGSSEKVTVEFIGAGTVGEAEQDVY